LTAIGDVVLVIMPAAGGAPAKLRPALVLAALPGPFQVWLLCGISSQSRGLEPGWDEPLEPASAAFVQSRLHRRSFVRLSFLDSVKEADIAGRIGTLPTPLVTRLRRRLAARLTGG
jgi:mRNA interferase MazF